MIAGARLHLNSLVLFAWSALWAAGMRGDVVVAVALGLTGAATVVAELERKRRCSRD